MPTDCRGTLRRTVRSRNNRIATVRGERCSADGNLGGLLQRGGAVRAGSLAVARQGKLLFARGYTWAEPDYRSHKPIVRSASLA